MKPKKLNKCYKNQPSYYTAVSMAYKDIKNKEYDDIAIENNLNIPQMDDYIEKIIPIKYKKFIEMPYRTKLSDFNTNMKAILLLEENLQYVYVKGNTYYSNTNFNDSNIMCIWCIEEEKELEKELAENIA